MADQSHLDERYFVDEIIYNCPFCNRRHVTYTIYDVVDFNWTENKTCRCFFTVCHSCNGKSMHLTFDDVEYSYFGNIANESRSRFEAIENTDMGKYLDNAFFYSVPTSFFSLDNRVPRILRELLVEAEGCHKSNYLTGASACVRKIIYELGILSGAAGDNYEDRIKSLKQIHEAVEPSFFDTLLTIQQVSSTKVHENSYDGWEAKHLRIILAAIAEVLHEIYVVPALREDRRKAILTLKDELTGSNIGDDQKEA